MNSMFEITTTNGQFYYDLFYFISIVFAGIFFMMDGWRKKYPMAGWSLIFSSAIIFLIIGTKLFTYSPNDWKEIVNTGIFPYTERKTILGGIIGGIIGIWIAKKLIRFPHPVLDSFAGSFPVAMAIQRIGCLMVGCCYGTPTNVPWAVSYSYHAIPYWTHLGHGLINETSCMSLPVHPNQLYQTLLCLLIAFVVWKLKNIWKRPGNLFFTSVALYMIARFIVEFWRDGASNGIAGIEWMGLKYVQWALLMVTPIMISFIFIRERKFMLEERDIKGNINPVWYYILLCVFALIASNWFTKTEFFFIEFVLVPTTILQLNKILGQHSDSFRYRLASVYSLLFVIMLSGTVIAQKTYNELTGNKSSRNRFNDISFGYGNLKYAHYNSPPVLVGTGCLGSEYQPVGPLFQNNSNVFGGGITHIKTFGKFQKLTLKAEVSAGWNTEKNTTPKNTIAIWDISPFVKYDFRWFGAGVGFHYGMNVDEQEQEAQGILVMGWDPDFYYSTNNNSKSYFHFSGNLRLFPYDIFYAELRYNEMFPYQIGHRSRYAFQLLVGSGFGFKDGSGLELGLDGNSHYFLSAKALLKNKYGVRVAIYNNFSKIVDDPILIQMMQFSVSYRLNQKHWSKKVKANK